MKTLLSITVAVILLLVSSCSKDEDIIVQNEDIVVQNEDQVFQQKAGTWSGGYDHGYWWSMWYDGGSCKMSFPSANQWPGNFQVEWSKIGDGGGGKGWQVGSARVVNYNVGLLSGYNWVGMYGWTKNPLIEYYITDFGSHSGTSFGSLNSDGGTYKCYKNQRVNAPSIIGTATFWQYFSDRTSNQSLKVNHSINTGNHFNYWKSKGGQGFGSFEEMKFNVEAMGGKSGILNATIW